MSDRTIGELDAAINAMDVDELRKELRDFAHENRRLRYILNVLASAGVGKGALVEVYQFGHTAGVVVCRADVDEVAFMQDVRGAVERLARAIDGDIDNAVITRRGVTK